MQPCRIAWLLKQIRVIIYHNHVFICLAIENDRSKVTLVSGLIFSKYEYILYIFIYYNIY